ncbi:MAG: HDIG domain-containing protein [Spirochaetia bacterium]|nr:HDIG domain-containing protein [Spirochaetia bacterium]
MKANQAVKNKNKGKVPLFSLSLIILTIITISLAVIAPTFFYQSSKTLMNDINATYVVGQIADKDVIASQTFYYIDEKETRINQEKAYNSTPPIFTSSLVEAKLAINTLHEEVENTLDVSQLSHLDKDKVAMYSQEIANDLIEQGIFDSQELKKVLQEGYSFVTVRVPTGYMENWSSETREVKSVVSEKDIEKEVYHLLNILDPSLNYSMSEMITIIVKSSLRPNILLNPFLTATEREEAKGEVLPVMVKVEEGQFLIKKNFVIQEEQIKTIKALRLASVEYSILQHVGRVLFASLITIASLYALFIMSANSKRKYQILTIYLISLIFTQLLTFFILYIFSGKGFLWLDPFLPVFFLPLLLSLVTNKKRIGMVSAITIASFMTLYTLSTVTTFFFIIAISFISTYFIKYVSKRIDMIYQWLLTLLCSTVIVLLNSLITDYSFATILTSIAIVASNISLTYIIVTFVLPILEITMNIPTPFRLRELSLSHTKGLVKLSQVAVGTYNHSLAVAELARCAANAIGADPLLAYVGALYHDIGKQENPDYFIENQSGDNKHTDLKASLSVAIIKSHVKIGLEKGREDKLPIEVLDIINEHHGTDIIAIFLKEAQEEAASGGTNIKVGEHDYSYKNEIPQTPESAIVMLADSVEAASRSIGKGTSAKYEKMIYSIIMGKIERKQLFASRLTLNDLDDIAKAFFQNLIGKYHVRMKYPGDKEE